MGFFFINVTGLLIYYIMFFKLKKNERKYLGLATLSVMSPCPCVSLLPNVFFSDDILSDVVEYVAVNSRQCMYTYNKDSMRVTSSSWFSWVERGWWWPQGDDEQVKMSK